MGGIKFNYVKAAKPNPLPPSADGGAAAGGEFDADTDAALAASMAAASEVPPSKPTKGVGVGLETIELQHGKAPGGGIIVTCIAGPVDEFFVSRLTMVQLAEEFDPSAAGHKLAKSEAGFVVGE